MPVVFTNTPTLVFT